MGRSPTIFNTADDRARFGSFLRWALTLSGKDEAWLEEAWHQGAVSKHENRRSALRAYLGGERIPDLDNLDRLASLLCIPRGAMYVSAGYIDEVLTRLCTAAKRLEAADWEYDQSPRVAAIERIASLFPGDGTAEALDQSTSLNYIIEKVGRINVGGNDDFLHRLWPFWTWVMPKVIWRKDLVHREQRNFRKSLLESGENYESEPDVLAYSAIQAEREFSLADPVTTDLLTRFSPDPQDGLPDLVASAVENLRDRAPGRSWRDRTRAATNLVTEWIQNAYGDPDRIRSRLRPCQESAIKEEEYALYIGHIQMAERERNQSTNSTRFE